jgi:hypothetical protein
MFKKAYDGGPAVRARRRSSAASIAPPAPRMRSTSTASCGDSAPAGGAAAGTVFGLVQDAIYRVFLGLNGLTKTIAGFAASLLSRVVRTEDLISRIVMIMAVSALDSGVLYLMLRLLEQQIGPRFWVDGLIKALVTGIAGGIGSRFYDYFKFPKKDFRSVGA